jgi:hypothetical protein
MTKRGCHITGIVTGPNRIQVKTLNGRDLSETPEMVIKTKRTSGQVTGRVTWEGHGRDDKHLVLKEDK